MKRHPSRSASRRAWPRALAGAVSLLAVTAFSGCSITTAKLTDAHVCAELHDGRCPSAVGEVTLSTAVEKLHATAELTRAPEDTRVRISWRYLEGKGVDIASVVVNGKGEADTLHGSLSRPTKGWPTGRYEAVFQVLADNGKPTAVRFQVQPDTPDTGAAAVQPPQAARTPVAAEPPPSAVPPTPAPTAVAPAPTAPASRSASVQMTAFIDRAVARFGGLADAIELAGDNQEEIARINREIQVLQKRMGKEHETLAAQLSAEETAAAKAYAKAKLGPIVKRIQRQAAKLQAAQAVREAEQAETPPPAIPAPTPAEAAPSKAPASAQHPPAPKAITRHHRPPTRPRAHRPSRPHGPTRAGRSRRP